MNNNTEIKNESNNKTQVIKAKIRFKKARIDKNNKKYLILELENDSSIFVFAGKISEERWAWLEENKEINFTVERGKGENDFVLVDFEIET